jgi:hypothetical protein
MRRLVSIAACAIFIMLCLTILAVNGQETKTERLEQLQPGVSIAKLIMRMIDLNEDKWISIEEYNKFFANLDQNKDGFVNEKEITDFMKKKQEDESGPPVGEEAPDFELRTLEGDRVVKLSDFRGKKPVVLVFGSYT